MYQILTRDGGELVATVRLDPYQFTMNKPNRNGIRRVLAHAGDVRQMNRTPGGESTEDETSPEGYQDPSEDFILNTVLTGIYPGHTLVEVERE